MWNWTLYIYIYIYIRIVHKDIYIHLLIYSFLPVRVYPEGKIDINMICSHMRKTEGYRNGKRHRQINRVTDTERGRETEITISGGLKPKIWYLNICTWMEYYPQDVTHISSCSPNSAFTRTDLKTLPLGLKTYLLTETFRWKWVLFLSCVHRLSSPLLKKSASCVFIIPGL